MKVKVFFLIFVFLCFSLTLFSQDAGELISQGDKLYSEMQHMAAAKEALAKYMEALKTAENKYDVYWRMARINYYIGAHTESKKEKKLIFSQGVYYGKKAVAAELEKCDGHYWLGVNNGKYGEVKGVLKSLALVKPIKNAMKKVIEIDPKYEDGGAYRVLGRVYFKLPGFAGGSKKKSLENLEKSKELGPEDVLTRLYLAETHLALKQKEKARAELEYIISMEDDPRWILGIKEGKENAKNLLQSKKLR